MECERRLSEVQGVEEDTENEWVCACFLRISFLFNQLLYDNHGCV